MGAMMKLISALVLGTLAALCIHPAVNASTVGNCQPNAVKYISDKTKRQTATDTAKYLAGSAVSFTTAQDDCVIVTMSATLQGTMGDYTFNPVLDGEPDTGSFPALVHYNFPATKGISAVFIFHDVAAGAHQIRMQWSTLGVIATAD